LRDEIRIAGLILRELRLRRLLRIRKTGWRLRGLLLGGGNVGENAGGVIGISRV
jgi:hypothetical protein